MSRTKEEEIICFLPSSSHHHRHHGNEKTTVMINGNDMKAIKIIDDDDGSKEKKNGRQTTTVINNEYGTKRNKTSMSSCSKICLNITLVSIIMSVMLGTTITGMSLRSVGEDEVGFYKDGSGKMVESGKIIFQLPWQRSGFMTVDMSDNKTMLVEDVDVIVDDRRYILPFCSVTYSIINETAFVETIQSKFNGEMYEMMNVLMHKVKFMLRHYNDYPSIMVMSREKVVDDLHIVVDGRIKITKIEFSDILPKDDRDRVIYLFSSNSNKFNDTAKITFIENDDLSSSQSMTSTLLEKYSQKIYEYLDSFKTTNTNNEGKIRKRSGVNDEDDPKEKSN